MNTNSYEAYSVEKPLLNKPHYSYEAYSEEKPLLNKPDDTDEFIP